MPIMLFFIYPAAILQACFLPPMPGHPLHRAPRPRTPSRSTDAAKAPVVEATGSYCCAGTRRISKTFSTTAKSM